MNQEPTKRDDFHPADRMANERTFLSWIRTAIAIIAFGFVVIKFLMPDKSASPLQTAYLPSNADDHALLTGISFFLMGAAISTLAYLRYRLMDKQIVLGINQHSFQLPTLLLLVILSICALLIFYFLKTAFR